MKTLKTLPLIAALALVAPMAQASDDNGRGLTAEKRAEITQRLTGEGYDVRKIEMEDGEIEVYALKDGQRLELYLNPDLTVRRTKIDD
ncbi:Peptidase propeptide and YPEB domain-containing protein [Lutimaribacter pacificus]|uniref:Peptidase propeptide and YPEB domain-containing protein n=1 Tax=Lutimaribacter pacificus TaxID=391948 RepID=A0A1H0LP69_9RHOB|nr:PepSY domain-containing protein [Lutimaribacter pacificus]SDO69811.1 Peptidase propeptide and YPEB domain-containing protein [Lutimaribacter pacificus]SHK05127.1 Peptidase propeptide and YPEB domain-containing protein [Lutimaribacter pacificus]